MFVFVAYFLEYVLLILDDDVDAKYEIAKVQTQGVA